MLSQRRSFKHWMDDFLNHMQKPTKIYLLKSNTEANS